MISIYKHNEVFTKTEFLNPVTFTFSGNLHAGLQPFDSLKSILVGVFISQSLEKTNQAFISPEMVVEHIPLLLLTLLLKRLSVSFAQFCQPEETIKVE